MAVNSVVKTSAKLNMLLIVAAITMPKIVESTQYFQTRSHKIARLIARAIQYRVYSNSYIV